MLVRIEAPTVDGSLLLEALQRLDALRSLYRACIPGQTDSGLIRTIVNRHKKLQLQTGERGVVAITISGRQLTRG